MTDTTFDEIYSSHYLYVRKFLLRLCKGNEHMADDLTQETFFQAYISIHRFEGNSRVETWLCSIAQNVFLVSVRKEKKHRRIKEIQMTDENAGYIMQEGHYLEHDVMLVLKQLPQLTAKVLTYRLFHNTPYAEISKLLGVSESSAKVIYHRGRIKLKEILEKEYGYEI